MSNLRKMFSNQARKAIIASAIAGVGTAVAVAPDGVTLGEALTIAGATLTAFQATYWTPNSSDAPTVTPAPAWVDERA